MESKHKNALIGGLLAIVFVMAVGYAAFATQLNINGTANITSNWDVHIESIEVSGEPTGTATDAGTEKTKVEVDKLTATFESSLQAPGDSVTYNVKVVNKGTLPAKLSAITFAQTNNGTGTAEAGDAVADNNGSNYQGDNAIVYSYSGIAQDDELEATTGEKTFQVTVTYNPKVTGQPDAKQLKSNLKMALTFVQKTE